MRKRSSFGWLELVIGVLLVALGIMVFARPDLVLSTIVYAYAIVAIVMGVADIILYIRMEQYTGFAPILSLISGILSVMSGITLVVYPTAGRLILTVLFPIWFIAHCISRLSHLHHIRFVAGDGVYYFALIVNIIGLILGFSMILSPLLNVLYSRYLAGAYLILLGVESIVIAASPMGRRS